MAGNTGKMTREAILQRGPRKALLCVERNGSSTNVICMPDKLPFSKRLGTRRISVMARSYDTKYLLRIGKSMEVR